MEDSRDRSHGGMPSCGLFMVKCNWFEEVQYSAPGSTGSLEDRILEKKKRIIAGIEETSRVVDPGLIGANADVARAIRLYIEQDVDVVLILFATWAEDFTVVRLLRELPPRLPVVFYCHQEQQVPFRENTGSENEQEYLNNTSLVGSLQVSSSFRHIRHRNEPTAVVFGPLQTAAPRISLYAKAAHTKKKLENSRIGVFRSMNEVMWSTYVDVYRFFFEVGPQVSFYPFDALADETERVQQSSVREEMSYLTENCKMEAGVDRVKLERSVRVSLALGSLGDKHELDAIAFNDVDPNLHELVGLRPGFYPRWYHDSGRVIVPEGDISLAALASALSSLTGQRFMYIEPFFSDFDTNTFVAGHAGALDFQITEPHAVHIAPDLEYSNSAYRYAGAPFASFTFPLGTATVVHMGQRRDSYVVVYSLVESVHTDFLLHGYPYGAFRPSSDLTSFFEQLLNTGVTQHFLALQGDIGQSIEVLADFMGWQTHRIV